MKVVLATHNCQRHILLITLQVDKLPISRYIRVEEVSTPKFEVGNIRFRPPFPFIIRRIDESRILHRRPTKESIVANEGSHFAISTAKRDTFVDTAGRV